MIYTGHILHLRFGWATFSTFKLAMLVPIFVELSQLSANHVLGRYYVRNVADFLRFFIFIDLSI